MTDRRISISSIIRRHPLGTYTALTMAFSWSIEFLLAAAKHGWIAWRIPFSFHYLASLGPGAAAVLVTAVVCGRTGLKDLWSRIIRWRAGRSWIVFSLLSAPAMFGIAALLVRLVRGEWPDLRLLGQPNFLPYLGAGVLPLWLLSFGFGEEIGWRGFLLPRLQRTMSASKATFLLALLWAIWHAPAFLYLDTLRQSGLIILPGFLVGVLFAAVAFTWIYNGTGGSILYVAIWHALFDMFTASKVAQDIIPPAMTFMVIAIVLIITRANRPWNFHRLEKSVL